MLKNDQGLLQLEYGFAYWLTFLLLLVGCGINAYVFFKRSEVSAPKVEPGQSVSGREQQIPENATACASCSTVVTVAAPNPVAGLFVAFESLGGQARPLMVGILFGAAFALCVLFAAYRVLPKWGSPHGFTGFIKILVVSVAPFVSLFCATLAARKAFRAEGGFGHDSFIAGASSLPFGCVALLAAILGLGNIEVIGLSTLFAICLTILMLFAGLT